MPPRTSGSAALRWLIGAVASSTILLTIALVETGLRVQLTAWDTLPYYAAVMIAILLRTATRGTARPVLRRVTRCAEYYTFFTFIVLLGAIASYPVAAATHGFVDEGLARFDTLLHFDWMTWYRVVVMHPGLQRIGRMAYESIYWPPVILLGYYAWTERDRDAWRFMSRFWVAAILTLIVFRFMPAIGPLAYLWHGPVPYMPESALWQPELIPPLRLHAMHLIDLGTLRGLVSAPSFHTAAAVLYIVAAWPIRGLRVPLILLNGAMLLATPVEGTHYLTDMLIGALVAGCAVGLHDWMAHVRPVPRFVLAMGLTA
ncbi:phosphatase PAP2 family protein [uncultured Sphingomonas sp.]|uniref:phosphatase PAP2 family protein n=1 Tax=uncultured Sphingomonas sp. TaxID=158754 RepID=UPI0035C949A3